MWDLITDFDVFQRACLDKLREETAEFPEWQDFDDQSSVADGTSTRPMSSVGTPPPQRSGFKLKLNGTRATHSAGGGATSRGGTDSLVQSDDDEE